MKKHDQDYLKKQNRKLVFDILREHHRISRVAIAKLTGMSPTTVGRIVAELIDEGYLVESEQVSDGPGRKSTLLDIVNTSVLSIGIELDRDHMKLGVIDMNGQVLGEGRCERAPGDSPSKTLATIADMLKDVIERSDIDRSRIVGIGVGLPGIIDYKQGVVGYSVQLGWKNVRLADQLRQLTGFEVTVDNELKVKALGEHLKGAAIGSKRTALLGFGHGVGSVLILEGEIYRGEWNSAGEIGHTTVDPDGILCECGKFGCLQTYINIGSLLTEANRIRPVASMEELFAARQAKEQWAVGLFERALTYIAVTVNNIVCMYNPDSVILSGELIDKLPGLYDEIVELCESRFIWEPLRGSFTFSRSGLKERGVMIGSGLLAQDRFFSLD